MNDKIENIIRRAEEAKRNRIVAETQFEAAKTALKEMGFNSPKEAKEHIAELEAKITSLEAELAAEIEKIEEQLQACNV